VTRPYAEVIGDPIAHSKSPIIHNFWLKKLKIDAEYRACHVGPAALSDYFANRQKDADWRGCNVTIPHKETVCAHLGKIDAKAALVGAVNTIVSDYLNNNRLVGYNTDIAGFLEPLKRFSGQSAEVEKDPSAIIIGAGGAARAIAFALWHNGYALQIANRDRSRARAIADCIADDRSYEISTPSIEQLAMLSLGPLPYQPTNLAIIVNASAMGMANVDPLIVNLKDIDPKVLVYDIVYKPLETSLLSQARQYGLRTIDGLQMLIAQAAEAFELIFGETAPRDCDDELRALLVK
jgi:shikimate dehydrogenase